MSATSCCRAWRMSPSCARRTPTRASKASTPPPRRKRRASSPWSPARNLAKVITPWVGVLTHLKGLKSAPQHAIAIDRACWAGEAVCAVVARTRAEAEDGCELVAVDYEELQAITDAGNRARSQDACDPSRARRQSLLRARAYGRRSRQGLRRRRRRGRDHIHVRPPHRRHQRAARHRRRLEPGRRATDRLPGHAGAAHDAEPVRQASGAGGASGPRRHQGRRRLVRHQGAHLRRRDGDGRAVEAAQAARQIRRRPDRELRHRHPRPRSPHQGEDRREEGRHHHRVGDRRSHRHRPLLGLSAHQSASRPTRWST